MYYNNVMAIDINSVPTSEINLNVDTEKTMSETTYDCNKLYFTSFM